MLVPMKEVMLATSPFAHCAHVCSCRAQALVLSAAIYYAWYSMSAVEMHIGMSAQWGHIVQ